MSYTSRGNEVESEPFGLNFERHKPEAVELPKRPVRRGDKRRDFWMMSQNGGSIHYCPSPVV